MRLEDESETLKSFNISFMQDNIEKIASAKKFMRIDEDLESIYKSTDFRSSTDPKNNLFPAKANDFSPSTIKYIETQSTKVDLDNNSNNKNEDKSFHSKMSLSPGSLLEDPYFDHNENENENKKDSQIKEKENRNENDNDNDEINLLNKKEHYKARLTEFGLKNILSVIEENSNDKNEDSSYSIATWKKKNSSPQEKESPSFQNISLNENKENINVNSVIEVDKPQDHSKKDIYDSKDLGFKRKEITTTNPELIDLDLSFRNKSKFVNFDKDLVEISHSSQNKRKYKKTPILKKIQKRSYDNFEDGLINPTLEENIEKFKKPKPDFKIIPKANLQQITRENALEIVEPPIKILPVQLINSPKLKKETNQKIDCFKIIENSPLTVPQKNKLIEILSSNCKKTNSTMDLITNFSGIDIMELLKSFLREKVALGQKTSTLANDKKKELIKIRSKNDLYQKKILEKKEFILKTQQKFKEMTQKKSRIESLKCFNNKCHTILGLKLLDLNEKNSLYTLKFSIFGEQLKYQIKIQNRICCHFSYQNKILVDREKSFIVTHAKSLKNIIFNKIKCESEQNTGFKNTFELMNKISFYLNSVSYLLNILEKLQKDYFFDDILINDEEYSIELFLKYFNGQNKFIKFEINIFEWFHKISMSFEGTEKFPEKISNVLNTVFNSEITKSGIHKLERILEKSMNLKLKIK